MKKGYNLPPHLPIEAAKPPSSPAPPPKRIETISLSHKIETGETINFYGIYDPDDNLPEIRNLIEDQKLGWKKELARAVARYVIAELNKQEQEQWH